MRTAKRMIMTFWVVLMLVIPIVSMPMANAWTPGDEAEIFGHTFTEEYWTNDSIEVVTEGGNASLTTSYVHVGNFSAFMIAFNSIQTNEIPSKEIILPYQLFGMHFITPEQQEVFIGAIFAFLMVHEDNKTFADNNLPDVGNEPAWYIVPISSMNPWGDVTPTVEPIPAEKLANNHYRFGMRYTNMSARVVSAAGGFLPSLLAPLVTVLFSEIVIEYDIWIDYVTGEIHAETLYTIGQVTRARVLIFDVDPQSIINENMTISAVHYLSIFSSNYEVTNSATNNTIVAPTSTTPMDDNITITIGDNQERAFDIGLGREFALINETTTPWETVSPNETALNALLGARASDFLLIAWQAPLSIFLFAHMAYGLSDYVQSEYASPSALILDAASAYSSSQWWYAVAFPEWQGLRVEQDPVYVAYTHAPSLNPDATTTITEPGDGAGGILFLGLIVVAVIAIVILIRRRQ